MVEERRPEPAPGTSLDAGALRLEQLLGRGGMGAVYRARQEPLGRRVAVKLLALPDEGGSTEEVREATRRLADEARAAARLTHPDLVQVLGLGDDPDFGPYIVYELLPGTTLRDRLRAEGRLDWSHALAEVAGPLLRALAALHQAGVVHRDVKPENLLTGQDGALKLGDLGLALFEGREAKTLEGLLVGTPGYLAPERILRPEHPAGPGADLYAAALVLVEATTGALPFGEGPLSERLAAQTSREVPAAELRRLGVPAGAAAVLSRALRREPADRPGDARAFLADLEAATPAAPGGAAPTVALRAPPAPPARRNPGAPRRRSAVPLLAAVAVLALAAAGTLLRPGADAPPPAPPTPTTSPKAVAVVEADLTAAEAALEDARERWEAWRHFRPGADVAEALRAALAATAASGDRSLRTRALVLAAAAMTSNTLPLRPDHPRLALVRAGLDSERLERDARVLLRAAAADVRRGAALPPFAASLELLGTIDLVLEVWATGASTLNGFAAYEEVASLLPPDTALRSALEACRDRRHGDPERAERSSLEALERYRRALRAAGAAALPEALLMDALLLEELAKSLRRSRGEAGAPGALAPQLLLAARFRLELPATVRRSPCAVLHAAGARVLLAQALLRRGAARDREVVADLVENLRAALLDPAQPAGPRARLARAARDLVLAVRSELPEGPLPGERLPATRDAHARALADVEARSEALVLEARRLDDRRENSPFDALAARDRATLKAFLANSARLRRLLLRDLNALAALTDGRAARPELRERRVSQSSRLEQFHRGFRLEASDAPLVPGALVEPADLLEAAFPDLFELVADALGGAPLAGYRAGLAALRWHGSLTEDGSLPADRRERLLGLSTGLLRAAPTGSPLALLLEAAGDRARGRLEAATARAGEALAAARAVGPAELPLAAPICALRFELLAGVPELRGVLAAEADWARAAGAGRRRDDVGCGNLWAQGVTYAADLWGGPEGPTPSAVASRARRVDERYGDDLRELLDDPRLRLSWNRARRLLRGEAAEAYRILQPPR